MQSYRHRPEVIEARLAALERNPGLYADGNLAGRAVALDGIQQVYQCLRLHRHDAHWGRYQKTLGPQRGGWRSTRHTASTRSTAPRSWA